MKIFFNVLIPLLITCQYLHSQSPEPLSFYPHHKGDIWEYREPTGPYFEQNRILEDSLHTDGRYYLETTMWGKMIVDTSTNEVFRYATSYLQYKLDADSGDTWIVFRGTYYTRQAIVIDVFDAYIFGNNPVQIKMIDYVDSASGLLFETDYLASGFGLIQQDFCNMPALIIRGTLINGVQHGIITLDVRENATLTPTKFSLHQNYPNPFNSSTIIKYDIPVSTDVILEVYNVIGQKVYTLVDKFVRAGSYQTTFNPNNLTSGVYYYKLTTNKITKTNKLIILK